MSIHFGLINNFYLQVYIFNCIFVCLAIDVT